MADAESLDDGSDTVVDAEAELAPVLPERVYVKVGASNKYLSMAHAKQKVGLMDEGDFLRALHADPVFKGLIRGVDHSLVATRVVKGPLPSTTFPTAAHEADGVTIALSEGVTIAEAAASADTGAHLFVRVHAPAAADNATALSGAKAIRRTPSIVPASAIKAAVATTDRPGQRPMKEALRMLDKTCRFPGCGAAAQGCEAAHIIPHAHLVGTGPDDKVKIESRIHTSEYESPWNGVLMCATHHGTFDKFLWTLTDEHEFLAAFDCPETLHPQKVTKFDFTSRPPRLWPDHAILAAYNKHFFYPKVAKKAKKLLETASRALKQVQDAKQHADDRVVEATTAHTAAVNNGALKPGARTKKTKTVHTRAKELDEAKNAAIAAEAAILAAQTQLETAKAIAATWATDMGDDEVLKLDGDYSDEENDDIDLLADVHPEARAGRLAKDFEGAAGDTDVSSAGDDAEGDDKDGMGPLARVAKIAGMHTIEEGVAQCGLGDD